MNDTDREQSGSGGDSTGNKNKCPDDGNQKLYLSNSGMYTCQAADVGTRE